LLFEGAVYKYCAEGESGWMMKQQLDKIRKTKYGIRNL